MRFHLSLRIEKEETFVNQLAARGAKAVTNIEVFGIESRADKAEYRTTKSRRWRACPWGST
jgi:hypothetical protein